MKISNETLCKCLTIFIEVSKKYNKNISQYHIFKLSLLHVLPPIQTTDKTVNSYSLTTLGNIPYAHS